MFFLIIDKNYVICMVYFILIFILIILNLLVFVCDKDSFWGYFIVS